MNSDRAPSPTAPASPFELRYSTTLGLGRSSLGEQTPPSKLVAEGQRARILAAALREVTEQGYPGTTVAHIIAAARVSRNTFYDHFGSKEECVLATYDLIADWMRGQIVQAVGEAEDWPAAVGAAVETVARLLDADPRLGAFCAVEILRIGRSGLARQQASIEVLATVLRTGRSQSPWGEGLPPSLEETNVGGAIWLLAHRTRLGDPPHLTSLVPEVTYFLLVPYLGLTDALRVAGVAS